MSIFEYSFMQRAFVVGVMLALIMPCIGMTIVLKRMSMIGDALSHASLSGVALGLIFGFNPLWGATAVCILAAVAIELIRRRLKRYAELAIAIIMSAGIGMAAVLSGLSPSTANFNSYLFGSIVSITAGELWTVCGVSVLVLLTVMLLYRQLFYLGFDERAARVSGVPVDAVNFIFTVLTAATVSVAARTVGALIVSSMLVVPVACGMQLGRSYKSAIVIAVLVALLCTAVGLTLSYYFSLKPGGTIVLLAVTCFILSLFLKLCKK